MTIQRRVVARFAERSKRHKRLNDMGLTTRFPITAAGSASVPGMTEESAKAQFLEFIEDLIEQAEKAKSELQTRDLPSTRCSVLMGRMHRIEDEDWYQFFWR